MKRDKNNTLPLLDQEENEPTKKFSDLMREVYFEKFSPEKRQALADETNNKNNSAGMRIGEALAGLGQAFQMKGGSRRGTDLSYFQDLRKENRKNTLGEFDRNKQNAVQDLSVNQKLQEQDYIEARRDPNSELSVNLRNTIAKDFPGLGEKFGNMNVEEIEKFLPNVVRSYENRAQREFQSGQLDKRLAANKEIANANLRATMNTNQAELNQDQLKMIGGLRKESTSGENGKLYRAYATAKKTKEALNEFANDPSGYSDFGTLMQSLKSLQGDDSVIREAELRLGKNATSLINKAKNAIQSAINGKSLQPEQRDQILDVMDVMTTVSEKQYADSARPIFIQANQMGLPLNQIFSDPEIFQKDYENILPEPDLKTKEESPIKQNLPSLEQRANEIEEMWKAKGANPPERELIIQNLQQKWSEEKVRVMGPNGQIKLVPRLKVQDALNAGGKIINE